MAPTMDAMLMMVPPRCLLIYLSAALAHRNEPFKLMPSTKSQSSSFIRRISPSRVMPALFTRMSIRPNFPTTSSIMAETSAEAATFALIASDFLPFASMSAAVFWAASRFTSQMAVSAPSAASASAISLPMPCAAPVTSAILLVRLMESSSKVKGSRVRVPGCYSMTLATGPKPQFLHSQRSERLIHALLVFDVHHLRVLGDSLHKTREHLAGADFDEGIVPLRDHVLDRVFPVERGTDLLYERRPEFRRRPQELRLGVVHDRDAEVADVDLLQFPGQPVSRLLHHSAVRRYAHG